MKTIKTFLLSMVAILAGILHTSAQSNFSPEAYKQFLNESKSLTSSELLSNNPPKTTYYSSRLYPTDLMQIPWYDSLNSIYHFTADENKMLAQNNFMVSERLSGSNWAMSMVNIYNNDMPLFISTDFVLHTLHNSYDAILQTIEWQLLEPNLIDLLSSMRNSYSGLYEKYKSDERFAESLSDVDLYLAIANSLLENEEHKPLKHTDAEFVKVMDAIEAEQMTSMPLFTKERTRKLDFSQFTPRGHYTETFYTPDGERTLEDYFKAMMWLGRIDFLLTAPPENPWETDWTEDELRRMQLSAVLLNELLHTCGKKDLLDTHEKIISFLVGPDDNLNPNELKGISDKLLSHPNLLFEKTTYDAFTNELNASDDYGQKIMSNFFYVDPFSSDPGKLPISFKLLGQKFILDSYITAEVVYDRIIWEDAKVFRGLPDPLDVMAVLGSEDAMALLQSELETYHYAPKIASLKHLVDNYDEDFWEQSLYNTWLSCIKELNPTASSDDLPYFMKTTAWHHEKLNTQLTSWAELRHDNLLYAKQSYTGGTACSFPYTYIEPYPNFYSRIEKFSDLAADFFTDDLKAVSFTSKQAIIDYYKNYGQIVGKFKVLAQKELDDEEFNEADITFLKTMINEFMASGPSISGWLMDMYFDKESGLSSDYVVADIHTQPTDAGGSVVGHVYHVGNGKINMGVFFAPNPVNPNQTMAFIGPVSSFHYEVTNNFKRLTDEEWEQKFNEGKIPKRPDWVANYLINKEGNTRPEARKLKGEIYKNQNYNSLPTQMNDVDYILAFPNPVTDIVNLRFVLNKTNHVSIEILNSNGSTVDMPYENILTPAEHNIPISLTKQVQGIYFINITIGNQKITKKITVL